MFHLTDFLNTSDIDVRYVNKVAWCNGVQGNDLARVLRWGPGYTGAEDPLSLLRDVTEAEEIKLDR